MSKIVCLEFSVLLWIAHVLAQVLTARGEFGDAYLISPRDKQLPTKGVASGRATRALRNYVENLVPFVALALALIATGRTGGLGATIWIIARNLYLPAYVMGDHLRRTALWGIAVVGLLMLLWRLTFAA